jgi:hypothetical protein
MQLQQKRGDKGEQADQLPSLHCTTASAVPIGQYEKSIL